MDANRNTVIDYSAVAPSDGRDSVPATPPGSRSYVGLAVLLVALMLAVLLLALLAQPVHSS